MAIHVKNNVNWVGQRDWEVRDFHGTEYKTLLGSSYNSYLIREEKNVLIDTVDHKFSREFVQNLRAQINLEEIDYIIINHAEEDHAGALTELMSFIPNTPIYCTANAIDSINGHHHHPEWNFNIVKTGDSLDIGNGKQLIFVETPMLHWPDSMMTYLTGDAILFSNDAFGQHYCDERLFNDEVDQTELFEQCQRYYANILTPFSRLVTPKINEILGFNLPVDMIATSHGVVWRDNPTQIVELYLKWAADYQEDRITIFYDTMSNNTRMMADAIAQGINEIDPNVFVKSYNVAKSDKNDIITSAFRSKGVLVGSSTMNNVMMPKIAAMLEEMTGLRFRNKKAAAFGSYGWNGGAVDRIQTRLMDAGFETALALKTKWRPDMQAQEICREYGREIARQWALAPLPATQSCCTTSSQPEVTTSVEAIDLGPRMQCSVCQWIYDPAVGEPMQNVQPNTPWSEVPDSFLCPECSLGKDVFDALAKEAK
ncbi:MULTISPECIES: anaerobic nitric oxide reductase flavorubredoxin [Proteus]|jgi:anaerobic nitric oxide reductase flavorubredoxin|uniref:anaerobic nitric oxide reductase flavorubredoxin n=1 Tax=Proteus TaxID=583 RepID=UPI000BFE88FC|nr:anaerobic nitric oxide reductase flavorubredoxin [Proteus terrae]ATM99068.1 anaerobic nitric oxide reductase flavorubredoxin [Proteus vulgaris]MDY3696246.1 anaerobic nitric oxide reductase flavorubredoxin [Proteus mirabilis]MBG2836661.1 anaerobic nitric oxide reductase flavorubredoxin [Proteus terrae subsp. cibarius]MBG2868248.1 anaerobic nitric oxide reductase flavorubredoxin [Proteus terrae subsp. cibarius]MBJ2108703.1 anaerobic nitric oxide reductase flavorubredoxin [Proteus terrae]